MGVTYQEMRKHAKVFYEIVAGVESARRTI